jgi:high-affinity iron transporter
MLAAALIVFREVLEAGLIIGVVLAATEGILHRGLWIVGGVAGGVLGAGVVALFAGQLANAFSGSGQDVFNAAILIAAVAMLSWHVLWMSRHAREMVQGAQRLGARIAAGEATLFAMAIVVAVAVLREGSEVVLFLFGIASAGGSAPAAMMAGSLMGLAGGGALSWLIYRGLLVIPTSALFTVTNGLVSLLAAGMAGQAAVFLVKAEWIPSLGDELWDTSGLLSDASLVGRALHALVGYSDRPMGVQIAAYLAVLAALLGFGRALSGPPRRLAAAK